MSNPLICSALGVPTEPWPTDHYALLGISPGAVEPAIVEQHVLERMERLRRYQLVHPDAVTEAMNLLAQALVCLSDPKTKAEYDASMNRGARHFSAQLVEVSPATQPASEPMTDAPISARRMQTTQRRAHRTDHRRILYRRLSAARRLLSAWRELGRFIGSPNHRVRRPAEAIDLAGALLDLRDCIQVDDAPVIGAPGQGGALVVALARQALPISTYRHFLPDQRAALASDWREGERILSESFHLMAHAVHRPRGNSAGRIARRLGRTLVTDWLDVVLIVIGCAAVGIALLRTF